MIVLGERRFGKPDNHATDGLVEPELGEDDGRSPLLVGRDRPGGNLVERSLGSRVAIAAGHNQPQISAPSRDDRPIARFYAVAMGFRN